jgi:hypothetical protein
LKAQRWQLAAAAAAETVLAQPLAAQTASIEAVGTGRTGPAPIALHQDAPTDIGV